MELGLGIQRCFGVSNLTGRCASLKTGLNMNCLEDKIKIVSESHHKRLSEKFFNICSKIPQTLGASSAYQVKRNVVAEIIKGKAITHSRIAMELKKNEHN